MRYLARFDVLAEALRVAPADVFNQYVVADPAYDPANVEILARHLGGVRAARTVVCARLLEPSWLIEVEAVAAVAS